jgi:phosphate transport system substrate-binding protein
LIWAAGTAAVSGASTPASGAAVPAAQIKGPYAGEAKSLDGAGATFPAPLYTRWFSEYEKLTGVKINYQAIGSGGGIKAIQDQTVDFGASDATLTDQQLKDAKGGELFHIPASLGAVVATYNIPGYSGKMRLTPDTISAIFLGDITKWNDPKLVADNPDLSRINADIVTIHRSDGSGTTFAFTDYLSSVSSKWNSSVGKGTTVNWPTGLGGQGNDGVAGEVKNNPNSIGYVELIYALQQRLGFADVKNKSGSFVTPTLDSVTAAAQGAANNMPADLRASIVNPDGAQAYPISTFTYLLVYKNIPDKAKATAITRMAWWGIHDGQAFAKDLGYAPLPAPVVQKAEEKINQVTTGGQKAFPGS